MSAGRFLPLALHLAAQPAQRWWRVSPRRRRRHRPYDGPTMDPRILRDALERKLQR